MKKIRLPAIVFPLLLALAMFAGSCTSAPKNKKTPDSAPAAEEAISAPAAPEEPFAEAVDAAAAVPEEEPVLSEPVLAEESIEAPPLAEDSEPSDVLTQTGPEPPAVLPPPAVTPPAVVVAPPPETPSPELMPTPPPVVTPPAAAPPVPPPAAETPPVKKETPPAVVTPPPMAPPPVAVNLQPDLIPPPRSAPELPYPTAGNRWQDEKMVFSRVVRATAGQLVEIPFRGTGWVYLGEAGSLRGITYDSRRLDPEGQSFVFRTESAGEYALKFFRQDFIRDFILNDYVQVIVGNPPETAGTGWFNPFFDRGRVIAEPRWPSSLQEAQAVRADDRSIQPVSDVPAAAAPAPPIIPPAAAPVPAVPPSARSEPAVAAPSPAPAVASPAPSAPPPPPAVSPSAVPPPPATPNVPIYAPELYLEKAKEEFDAGRAASAISLLDQFREYYPSGSDELWWLYGQFYEANSPSRNILAALDCYRRLIQEYPQSSRYDDARRRVAYLQRYYINNN